MSQEKLEIFVGLFVLLFPIALLMSIDSDPKDKDKTDKKDQ